MAYPVPEVWTISGILKKNGVPFFEGKVYADNLKNADFKQIAESGISSDGSFSLLQQALLIKSQEYLNLVHHLKSEIFLKVVELFQNGNLK